MRSPELRRAYAIAFGVIGLIGGLAFMLFFGGATNGLSSLAVTTSIVCAGVGYTVAGWRRWLLSAVLFGLLGGLVNGVINAVLLTDHLIFLERMSLGASFGLCCSIPFLPALAFVSYSARHTGRATRRSIIDALDRRALVRATSLVCVAGAAIMLGLCLHHSRFLERLAVLPWIAMITMVSTTVFSSVVVYDLVAFRRIREAKMEAAAWRAATDEDLDRAVSGPDTLAIGLGEQRYVRFEGDYTFRRAPSVWLTMTGDLALGERLVSRALFFDALCAPLALTALVAAISRV